MRASPALGAWITIDAFCDEGFPALGAWIAIDAFCDEGFPAFRCNQRMTSGLVPVVYSKFCMFSNSFPTVRGKVGSL
jgi:hypothetical protein